jgi:hypothetical protein
MMATSICARHIPPACVVFLQFLCLLTLATRIGFAAPAPSDALNLKMEAMTARAQKKYVAAQKEHLAQPGNVEAAWHFARACFDRAEFATNNAERAALAQQGIIPCREALARGVRIAPVHYYLAMNLGQLARTKTFGALKLVDEMEREFKMARALDEHLDFAGPDRCLGRLYGEAPRIGSIGSRSKARQHMQRAVEVSPDYPENRLNLAEAFLKWTDFHLAKRELKALDELWPKAKTYYSGPDWDASWLDWEPRLIRLRERIEEQTKAEATRRRG